MFEVRVITSADEVTDEAAKITSLFESGVDYVHIRKPSGTLAEVRRLIEDIPYRFRKKIVLHGHFDLLNEMNLGGVSLNSRNPKAPVNAGDTGIACHSIREIEENTGRDFFLLSPVYPSISKPGYLPAADLLGVRDSIIGKRVIALGGVTPERFRQLQDSGYSGAALLGYVWENEFDNAVRSIVTERDKLN